MLAWLCPHSVPMGPPSPGPSSEGELGLVGVGLQAVGWGEEAVQGPGRHSQRPGAASWAGAQGSQPGMHTPVIAHGFCMASRSVCPGKRNPL